MTSTDQRPQQPFAPAVLQLLRLPAVKARTGLSRSTIYNLISAGTFPPPVAIGARAVGWDSRSINAWIERKLAQAANAR